MIEDKSIRGFGRNQAWGCTGPLLVCQKGGEADVIGGSENLVVFSQWTTKKEWKISKEVDLT